MTGRFNYDKRSLFCFTKDPLIYSVLIHDVGFSASGLSC